jgi:hypothetical protein
MLIGASGLPVIDLVLSMDYAFFWGSGIFLLSRTIGNLDQFSTGINAQRPTKSYEYGELSITTTKYGELSITTTKFANFVSHRLKNGGKFLKWLFIPWSFREPEAFKFLALTPKWRLEYILIYMNHYDWWYGRRMYQLDHIASAEGSGT